MGDGRLKIEDEGGKATGGGEPRRGVPRGRSCLCAEAPRCAGTEGHPYMVPSCLWMGDVAVSSTAMASSKDRSGVENSQVIHQDLVQSEI